MATARFIYDIPEKNADLYYACGFRAPDAVIYFETGGKKFMVLGDLEIDRGRRESKADKVLSLSKYQALAAKRKKAPVMADVIHEIFKDAHIRRLVVPQETSFTLVDDLKRRGYRIEAGDVPFCPERSAKSAAERKNITEVQSAVFASIALARDVLKKSRIKGRRLVFKGQVLTSERLKAMINIFLFERGCLASETIVSCGLHAIDPHDSGSGPLAPHSSIIIDVYPKSMKTFYCGDATRTFCCGRAPEALKRMYATVREAQEMGIRSVRAGVNGRKIHESILKFFDERGYHTGEKDGRQQGFFHGTGHSIGLEVHEEPYRINKRDYILKSGSIMSVEPGLYYKDIGGVRIEDLVQIKPNGCDVIGRFPKQLEV